MIKSTTDIKTSPNKHIAIIAALPSF